MPPWASASPSTSRTPSSRSATWRAGELVGGPGAVQPGPPQRLVGVDVADAADQGLVEQRPLDLGVPPPQGGREGVDVEGLVERVDGDVRQPRRGSRRRHCSSTARPPKVRWSTKRSSRPPSVKVNRARRCVSSGWPTASRPAAGRSCPGGPTRAPPEAAPSGSASGSHRYLPRRWAAVKRAAGQRGDEVLGALEVPADGARVVDLDGGDGAAGDPLLQAAPDHLDLGQLGHRRRSGVVGQRAPGRLGGLLLGGLLGPAACPRPCTVAGEDDGGGEGLGVVGALVLDAGSRARRGRGRRRAPGGWSSSPGRRRGWRPRPASGRTAGGRSPTAVSRPQPRWIAPISASRASARIESFSRPPVVSSPRPSSRCGPMPPSPSRRATPASDVMLTTEARSLASWPSGRSGWLR